MPFRRRARSKRSGAPENGHHPRPFAGRDASRRMTIARPAVPGEVGLSGKVAESTPVFWINYSSGALTAYRAFAQTPLSGGERMVRENATSGCRPGPRLLWSSGSISRVFTCVRSRNRIHWTEIAGVACAPSSPRVRLSAQYGGRRCPAGPSGDRVLGRHLAVGPAARCGRRPELKVRALNSFRWLAGP